MLDERGRRPRFSRLGWLFGGLFSGKFGLVALAVLVVGGVGLLAYEGIFGKVGSSDAPRVVRVDHPEAGRELTSVERSLAERFGIPLRLGVNGRPVVRMEDSGEVRELTPVEVEFPAGSAFEYSDSGSAWAPGPRGWGVWWDADMARNSAFETLHLGRESWVARQNEEMERALLGLEHGVRMLLELDFETWRYGQGEEFAAMMRAYVESYPFREPGYWGMIPERWVCSEKLEFELRHGVSEGCPSMDVVNGVSRVWIEIGVFAEQLMGIAEMAEFRDSQTTKQAAATNTMTEMSAAVGDLVGMRERLPEALERLRFAAEEERLSMWHEMLEGME